MISFITKRIPGVVFLGLSFGMAVGANDTYWRFPGRCIWAEHLFVVDAVVLVLGMGLLGLVSTIRGIDW